MTTTGLLRDRAMLALGLLAMLALPLLPGCSDEVKVNDTDVELIQYKELLEMQANPKAGPLVLVDARQPRKFAEGRIPGAINIFLPDLRASDSRLTGARAIVVYGGGWQDDLSRAAAKRLIRLRYNNIYEFRGGMEVWHAEGGTIEKDESAATAPAPAATTTQPGK